MGGFLDRYSKTMVDNIGSLGWQYVVPVYDAHRGFNIGDDEWTHRDGMEYDVDEVMDYYIALENGEVPKFCSYNSAPYRPNFMPGSVGMNGKYACSPYFKYEGDYWFEVYDLETGKQKGYNMGKKIPCEVQLNIRENKPVDYLHDTISWGILEVPGLLLDSIIQSFIADKILGLSDPERDIWDSAMEIPWDTPSPMEAIKELVKEALSPAYLVTNGEYTVEIWMQKEANDELKLMKWDNLPGY